MKSAPWRHSLTAAKCTSMNFWHWSQNRSNFELPGVPLSELKSRMRSVSLDESRNRSTLLSISAPSDIRCAEKSCKSSWKRFSEHNCRAGSNITVPLNKSILHVSSGELQQALSEFHQSTTIVLLVIWEGPLHLRDENHSPMSISMCHSLLIHINRKGQLVCVCLTKEAINCSKFSERNWYVQSNCIQVWL